MGLKMKNKKNESLIILNIIMPKLRLVFLLLVLLIPLTSRGQISVMDREYYPDLYIGVIGGYGLNTYKGTYLTFENTNECGKFTDGDGSGLLIGIKAEYKLSRRFNFYTSLVFEDRSGDFNSSSATAPVFITDDQPLQTATLEQKLKVKLNFMTLSPLIKYKPFEFDLGILLGPAVNFIMSDEITHTENITAPQELYYLNHTKSRTVLSGKIESKNSILLDLKAGISYGFQLEDDLKLSPEVFYTLPLMKVSSASDSDWKISGLQFLVSFSYGLK
jgi:hypothetical protein